MVFRILLPLLGLLFCTCTGQLSAQASLPLAHPDRDGEQIIALFQNLGRTTNWKLISQTLFTGPKYLYEPEGIVRIPGKTSADDLYYVSAGEYTSLTVPYGSIKNGTDRSPGSGVAHLIGFNAQGKQVSDTILSQPGDTEYHNGGIDFDGKHIWATIAEYRPNSTAFVTRIDLHSLKAETVLRSNDHQGGIVHDVHSNRIYTLNWGSRNASSWNLSHLPKNAADKGVYTKPQKIVRNPSYFIDYQDCKFLGCSARYSGRPVALCSGIATIGSGLGSFVLGGIALVDVESMVPLAEVPITMKSALGAPITTNPVDVSVENRKLRLYWMPDYGVPSLYIYEAQPDSPFQFGGGSQ